mmetsp:Transcript_29798/g.65111  ORF Transcript_29798/g.65111 Transcript_29798/m.65111 type:complete len:393 (-) Transcript_29798:225-1403(-)
MSKRLKSHSARGRSSLQLVKSLLPMNVPALVLFVLCGALMLFAGAGILGYSTTRIGFRALPKRLEHEHAELSAGRDTSNIVSPATRARAKAAILGAFVADAATMPLHWIYDTREIDDLVQSNQPEFFDPPSCPFYEYELGELSPYGDEALPLLESMASRGELDPVGFSEDLFEAFKNYRGRLNHASKAFMGNMRNGRRWPHCGVNDDQAHALVKVPAVVARYAGSPLLAEKMEQAIRVHQDSQIAVDIGLAASRVLEKVVLGSSIEAALQWAQSDPATPPQVLRAVREALEPAGLRRTTREAVSVFGKSCHLPGSFQGPLHTVRTAEGYAAAVRSNALAGGDSCSRAAFVAACFAAQDGLESIPMEWIQKVRRYDEIHTLVEQLVPHIDGPP